MAKQALACLCQLAARPPNAKVHRCAAVSWNLGKSSHNHGLHAARLALLVAGSFSAAGAKDVRSSFAVSATVRAVANIELASVPGSIRVTAADLARGFVDIEQPTQVLIRSNSQSGFALEVLTVTPMLRAMIIRGLDSDLELGADGGTVVHRWQTPHPMHLSLNFRFALAPDLAPGTYPWPLRLGVRPLESI